MAEGDSSTAGIVKRIACSESDLEEIEKAVPVTKDFPKPGILFSNFFPIFEKPELVQKILNITSESIRSEFGDIDAVVGADARGFLFGPMLALKLNVPFYPVRKKGKLPGPVSSQEYKLEYGSATLELPKGATTGKKVLLVDDLMATGGTMAATKSLVETEGGSVVGCFFAITLTELYGAERVGCPVLTLLER